ncbi:hypothetical protein KAW44_05990 [Candidatus Bipolaricaulota bacterium]|nr:hypothetical protein [Candidatus Bipolaricaulota bacterium]
MSRKATIGVLVGVLILALGASFLSFSEEEGLRTYGADGASVLLITNTTDEISDYVVIMFDQVVTLEHVYAFGGGEIVEVKDLFAGVEIHGKSKAGTYWGIRFEEGSGIVPGGTLQLYFAPADATVTYYQLS